MIYKNDDEKIRPASTGNGEKIKNRKKWMIKLCL